MYSDLIEDGYAYGVLQDYVKKFTCLPDTYDVKNSGAMFFMSS
jgi:hypothetical protein